MGAPKYFAWDYHTSVEVGSGCRTFAAQRFTEMGCRRVALITDKGLAEAGIVDQIKDIFEVQGSPALAGVYDRIEPDAVSRVINDCARWYRETAADGILALGGGSVLDSAKGVKLLLGMKATDIKELIPGNLGPYLKPLGKPLGIPHVAIPTTAGTGSEVSPIAVIYNEELRIKANILHPYIPADVALLDPDLTLGLSPKMTADTGFDALCHAVEGLASPGANCMIDALGFQSVSLILKNLPAAVRDGNNLEARSKMLVASNMAIMSFAMSGLFFPVHNIAHAVGGQLRISHGEANAVLLPVVLKEFSRYYIPRAEELARAFGVYKEGAPPESLLVEVVEAVRELQQKCGVKPVFDTKITGMGLENLFWAVKFDPAGIFYPLPDDIIKSCLGSCFEKQ
ncbi:alcohol dehydrogenase [Desulfocucumis palustris]|uniref:Alcohol dehydrogenase n=1 Tax=Desulfocucumis palustris TaxID=1898651 RepID=A0A2L2XE87_9FIRM|nr:iron-containing alcohol dehydrogenase [Desulfocucumis palustris]GBF34548.1 alcohol dehydrogenase [Desulfocucumis palustris]